MRSRASPIATYRLQLTPEFGFQAAAGVTGYLARLGVSHVYLSPVCEAVPGSRHGYDQTDPTRVREELGGEAGLEALVGAARGAGLGIVLDIVPNHMAAHHANAWWWGVLRHGPGSEYDRVFDVDWEAGKGRVVLPVLGAPAEEVIARGELRLARDAGGGRCVRYFDKVFPLRENGAGSSLSESGEEREGGVREVLARQHYELAFWREGLGRINYRRFFDVAELAGVRVEDPWVFERMHAKVLELVGRGWVDGVRVDHVDGLLDPAGYLRRLRGRLDEVRAGAKHPGRTVVLVEKILASGEEVVSDWPVDGTTGYEFLAAATSLGVEMDGLGALRREAAAKGRGAAEFRALAVECKREVAGSILGAELARVCRAVERCVRGAGMPVEAGAVREAVVGVSAQLEVYRTYADDGGMSAGDVERVVEAARRAAGASGSDGGRRAIGGVADVLALRGEAGEGRAREAALGAVRVWQQFTGPLAAKGVEDTALYRDGACPAMCDVGTEPVEREPGAVMERLLESRRVWGWSLNATDTHDAKRSEDVRARLAVLTRWSGEWGAVLEGAARVMADAIAREEGRVLAERDVSLIVHSALALWPDDGEASDELGARLRAYIVKAAREAKEFTRWIEPDDGYERACERAVDLLVSGAGLEEARRGIVGIARRTRPEAGRLSIGMVMLKALFPGVPDWYQGTEVRALSLVDPDNRRGVDYEAREALLGRIEAAWGADPAAAAEALLRDADSDGAKMFAAWRVLAIRRRLLACGARLWCEGAEMSATRWRWRATAGERRCEVEVNVVKRANRRGRGDEREPPRGVNQLTGRPAEEEAWASVVIEGVGSLWGAGCGSG